MKAHHVVLVIVALLVVAWVGAKMQNQPLNVVNAGESVAGVLVVSM